MGEKSVFVGEKSVGEKSLGENYVGEKPVGEESVDQSVWVNGMLAFVPRFAGKSLHILSIYNLCIIVYIYTYVSVYIVCIYIYCMGPLLGSASKHFIMDMCQKKLESLPSMYRIF